MTAMGLGRNRMSDDRVASEIHVKRDRHGTQVSLRYEGPADTFESAVSQCLLNLDLKCDNEAPPATVSDVTLRDVFERPACFARRLIGYDNIWSALRLYFLPSIGNAFPK